MNPFTSPSPQQQLWMARWQTFSAQAVRAFHRYANWLVGISWKRFALLAVALMFGAHILQDIPPFSFKIAETVEYHEPAAKKPSKTQIRNEARKAAQKLHYDLKIDETGIRIVPVKPASAASDADAGDAPVINIDFPKDGSKEEIARAIEQAKEQLGDLKRRAEAAQAATAEAEAARQEAAAELARDTAEAMDAPEPARRMVTTTRLGDFLVNFASLWILASAVIKAMYKGRIQAEVKAAQATETAEAESLKRQVVEARMAAMQAQVEPHFLFNTLASIDHLIETDPPRASQMQRNLIALLRASMPTMREANASGTRDLGRELAVIRPYLEILKVRMEERLVTEIDVPEGLLSAEFPPMMIQGLVENAIKHGLEPKAEGGRLSVKAEVVHGSLAVTVADTGLGFGRAATSGTGVGLANIRERLQLLYGGKASVTVTENQPSGTVVTITVPYRTSTQTRNEGAAS
jgi:hypothetical protein